MTEYHTFIDANGRRHTMFGFASAPASPCMGRLSEGRVPVAVPEARVIAAMTPNSTIWTWGR